MTGSTIKVNGFIMTGSTINGVDYKDVLKYGLYGHLYSADIHVSTMVPGNYYKAPRRIPVKCPDYLKNV